MTKPTGVNFATLDTAKAHDKGIRIQLEHPDTGALLPSYFTLRGEESDVVQAYSRAQINAYIRRQAKPDAKPQTIEELMAQAIEKLTIATIGWEGVEWDGEVLPCTPENCRRIYGEKWLREQLFKKLEEEGAFPLG